MSLSAGIVGLPNVGKSTIFNALTGLTIEAANYPFATIEPNVGLVEVPDERLEVIQKLEPADKVVPTTFQFSDIAGLVKGASSGEGLGNKFLDNIKKTDAIVHVVRAFEDDDIIHVNSQIAPLGDIETINTELILSDLESVQKRLDKVTKLARTGTDKAAVKEKDFLEKAVNHLNEGKLLNSIELNEDERKILKDLFLITSKPMIYAANISEDSMSDPESDELYQIVKKFAEENNAQVIPISGKMEEEISQMPKEDRKEFLEMQGVDHSGLDNMIRAAYNILDLETFFTAGGKETRAWTFKKGSTAPQAAGVIHSDFEKGFIRAETVSFEDLKNFGSLKKAKENGKFRSEGKDYIVQDGDIIEFRFNV